MVDVVTRCADDDSFPTKFFLEVCGEHGTCGSHSYRTNNLVHNTCEVDGPQASPGHAVELRVCYVADSGGVSAEQHPAARRLTERSTVTVVLGNAAPEQQHPSVLDGKRWLSAAWCMEAWAAPGRGLMPYGCIIWRVRGSSSLLRVSACAEPLDATAVWAYVGRLSTKRARVVSM